jgi:hypothetical protein
MSKLITLPPQLHVFHAHAVRYPALEMFARRELAPIKNREHFKPEGGLWTSTYHPQCGSNWVQWCLGEGWEVPPEERWQSMLLVPAPARVFIIDARADLERLAARYPGPVIAHWAALLDWEAIAKDYDAVHLTARGQAMTRFSYPHNLYGWDVECTLWCRWCFTRADPLPPTVFLREHELRRNE